MSTYSCIHSGTDLGEGPNFCSYCLSRSSLPQSERTLIWERHQSTLQRHYCPPTASDIPMHGWRPYSDMHRERMRAHAKHEANGGSMESRTWDNSAWLPVLTEEIGEVARVLCERELGNVDKEEARKQLIEELTQVGAMTAAWLDALTDKS